MKTKIVYISGAEVFDVADVRAALDTVRAALNLGDDTIVFGVPVDRDSAFADAPSDIVENAAPVDEPVEIADENVVTEPEIDTVAESEPEPIAPRRRGRPRTKKAEDVPVVASENTDPTPVAPAADTSAKVVPILSVLAAKSDVTDEVVVDENMDADAETDIVPDTEPDVESVAPADDDADTMHVTIGEMIVDDAPVAPAEKTLEELLELMTPLCDDHTGDETPEMSDDNVDNEFDTEQSDEVDATLEKLATEFAETEPQIAPVPKNTGTGKIGKLKNILPFKKARRDGGSSLRDDLFNWAGIAANDEEFAIPGFFANATGNK